MEIFENILHLFLVHANDHFAGLPRMEAIVRIANIPLVESGFNTASKVYFNLKVISQKDA